MYRCTVFWYRRLRICPSLMARLGEEVGAKYVLFYKRRQTGMRYVYIHLLKDETGGR
jgi:hypothetical protein